MQNSEGAWIFLSHSHRDLEKVRRIRNALEARGHNPLIFFLKCLDDADAAELDDLIRREIEARHWFILCQSPNARASKWVRDEIEVIKRLVDKVVEEIDLDDDLDAQVERVDRISKRATVFISYSRYDQGVAEAIRAALIEQDFAVFDEGADIRPGAEWLAEISQAINEAAERGFVLVLLSASALVSEWVAHELFYAFERRANIIPVIVEPGVLDALSSRPEIQYLIASRVFFDLSAGDRDERIAELVRSLRTREMDPAEPRDWRADA